MTVYVQERLFEIEDDCAGQHYCVVWLAPGLWLCGRCEQQVRTEKHT